MIASTISIKIKETPNNGIITPNKMKNIIKLIDTPVDTFGGAEIRPFFLRDSHVFTPKKSTTRNRYKPIH